MAKERFTWLIKPKNFVQLIGAEYDLLKKSGSGSLVKFYIAAIIIALILLLTTCSIFYATEMVFRVPQVSVLLATFISLLFVFIYIFLLNTFSKKVFADRKKEELHWWKKIRVTSIVRIGFVAFMAFLIAKPVEIFVFRESLEVKVELHKNAIFNSYRQKIESLNNADIQKIQQNLASYQSRSLTPSSLAISEQIKKLNNQFSEIQLSQANNFKIAKQRIERSDFLLYRIQTVSQSPLSWLICGTVIFLFLAPSFLIHSISTNDIYYNLKHDWERKLISEEYSAFCKWYTEIFKENFNLNRTCYSVFEDPPFNEKRKAQPSFQTQSDFLRKFSGE
jgi:hypothetical protein